MSKLTQGLKTSRAFLAALYENGFLVVFFKPTKAQQTGAVYAYETTQQTWASMNVSRVSAGRALIRIIDGDGFRQCLSKGELKRPVDASRLTPKQKRLCQQFNAVTGLA